jgi:class 3 adenylate cyclase
VHKPKLVYRLIGERVRPPEAMARSLALHNETLRTAFGHHGGVVYSTMGDGMVVVFASAVGAVKGVLEAQRSLMAAPWPDQTGALKVRMGLHTDEAVLRDGQYANRPLNRCARCASNAPAKSPAAEPPGAARTR